MSIQNYLLINTQTNVVDNVVVWDGVDEWWVPREGHFAIPQATTPAKVWELNALGDAYEMQGVVGAGQIGFVWESPYVVTTATMPNPLTITVGVINRAVSGISAYSFATEPTFQASITPESQQNITAYLTALDNILKEAQVKYDEGKGYNPTFPDQPEIVMLTPAGNNVPLTIGG